MAGSTETESVRESETYQLGTSRPPLGVDDLPDPLAQPTVAFLRVKVEPRRDLPVDAVRRVGAGMDEHLPVRVPWRVEVETAFVGPARQVGADVAGFLGVSEANARVIRHRAIRQLRECMGIAA